MANTERGVNSLATCTIVLSDSDDKIVVQHAEFRQFTSPRTGLPSSKYGNTYYHPNRKCIELKWGGYFSTSHVIIPDNVRSQLTPSQKDTLFQEFGIPQQ